MEEVLKQILGEISKINVRLEKFDQRFDAVDQRFDAVDQRFDAVDQRFDAVDQKFDAIDLRLNDIEIKLDAVIDQTAMLTEFRTDTKQSIEKLQDDIKFLMYKETQNERDIFF